MVWSGWEKFTPNAQPVAKRPKYGNKKTEVDGIVFDSAKEAKRYQELKMLEMAGQIVGLRLQARYSLFAAGFKGEGSPISDVLRSEIATYVADFAYYTAGPIGRLVVEDAKGVRTPVYRLKAKIFKANYGFAITEV